MTFRNKTGSNILAALAAVLISSGIFSVTTAPVAIGFSDQPAAILTA